MKNFIPATNVHFLTPFYDGFTRLFFGKKFEKIVEAIRPKAGSHLIDIGCGPGEVLLQIHKKYPHVKLIGLDIDPEILKIAEKKLKKMNIHIPLKEASATEIPFPDESFDIAVSSLMIHHLKTEDKKKFLHEAFRILRPGGKMYLFDFAPPKTYFGKLLSFAYGFFEEIDDGVKGKYWDFMKDAGFKNLHARFGSMLFELMVGEK